MYVVPFTLIISLYIYVFRYLLQWEDWFSAKRWSRYFKIKCTVAFTYEIIIFSWICKYKNKIIYCWNWAGESPADDSDDSIPVQKKSKPTKTVKRSMKLD